MLDNPALAVPIACAATAGLLGLAGAHDLGFRTVPNAIPAALLGCAALRHGAEADLPAALATGCAVFAGSLALWRLGMFGGGDAKLLGATAFALPLGSVATFLLGTALAGGGLALAFLALGPLMPATPGPRPERLLPRVLRAEARRVRRRGPLPYALAIAAGALAVLFHG